MNRRLLYLNLALPLLLGSAVLSHSALAQGQKTSPDTGGTAAGKAETPGSTKNPSGTGASTSSPASSSSGTTTPSDKPATAGPAGATVQIKQELTGEFSYRFLTPTDQTAPPAPFPTPPSAGSPIALTLPSTIKPKDAILEVTDKTRGNVARLPVNTSSVLDLTEASFKYVQTVFVPVQAKGKPVTDVLVTLKDVATGRKFNQAWMLKPADDGVAQFNNVPLGEPVELAVNAAGHPSKSQRDTITLNHPADGYHWATVQTDWDDVKTVAPPPPAPQSFPAVTSTPGTPGAPESHAGQPVESRPAESSNPLMGILNTILGLAVVAAIAYGLIWAFNKGHIKTLLDKAGINTAQMATGGPPQPSPFDKPAKAPLTPITEGTADPLGGMGGVGVMSAAPVMATGPRLIATMGAYAGNIFPLSGASVDIGRDTGNAVPLPNDTNASRRHATIQAAGGQFAVVDNNSSNGTFVNGVRIAAQMPQPLRSGDELQVGMTRFRFEA